MKMTKLIKKWFHRTSYLMGRRSVFSRMGWLLAALVVFLTTYMLVLPAISLDKNAGGRLAGLHMEQKLLPSRYAAADLSGEETDILSDESQENEDSGQDTDESMDAGDSGKGSGSGRDAGDSGKGSGSGRDTGDSGKGSGNGTAAGKDAGSEKQAEGSKGDRKEKDSSSEVQDGKQDQKKEDREPRPDQKGEEGKAEEGRRDKDMESGQESGTDGQDQRKYLTGTFRFREDGYEIAVKADEEAELPSEANFYSRIIRNPQKYIRRARKELGIKDFSKAIFLDIGFECRGKKIEPKAPVAVTIRLREELDAQVLHFTGKGVEIVKTDSLLNLTEEDVPLSQWDENPDAEDKKGIWTTFSDFFYYLFHEEHQEPPVSGSDGEDDEYPTTVQFHTDGFSVFAVVGKTYHKSILSSQGDDYTLTVTCPAQARIPEEAGLRVREITEDQDAYKRYLLRAENILVADQEENRIASARIFDIRIVQDGSPIRPSAPVEVRLDLDDAVKGEVNTYDLSGKNSNGFSGEKTDKKGGSFSFRTQNPSVFGLIGTSFEKHILAGDGKNYRIVATCGPEAGIPDGAELEVEELAEGSRQYQSYLTRTENVLGLESGSLSYARLFDLHIVKAGEVIQPLDGSTIHVDISLDDQDKSAEPRVVHFGKKTELMDIRAKGQTVSFEAGSFSVYAIVDVQEPEEEETTVQEVSDLDGKAFLMSVTKNNSKNTFYFMDTIVDSNKIAKTAANQKDMAAAWHFEKDPEEENGYYLYHLSEEGGKTYMNMSTSGNMSLSETEKTLFHVELYNNQKGKYYIYRKVGNARYGLNMFSGENGKGFAGWSGKDDGSVIVLTVPRVVPDDPLGLDGMTYGLINEKTGISGIAMMSDDWKAGNRRSALEVLLRMNPIDQDDRLYVAKDSQVTMWTFHNLSGNNYQVSTEVDGEKKYLRVTKDEVSLADEPDQYCILSIGAGKGAYSGKIRIANKDNYSPNLYSGAASNGFGSYNDSGPNEWFSLASLSDLTDKDFVAYRAYKVSVSDTVNVTDKSQVIVYSRVWNDELKEYEYYAIDHQGKLTRVYESGDTIEWIGLRVNNLLWDFTEYYQDGTTIPNYYYDLKNRYSGLYMAPGLDQGQLLSESPVGLNMNGRRYGDYYSSILAWDDPHYDYAGYSVCDGKLTCSPLAQAGDFYFAIMKTPSKDELTEVETVDNEDYGISMKMIDYNGEKQNRGSYDKIQTDVIGDTGNTEGLVTPYLTENGYPEAVKTGRSLSELYQGSTKANHLFLADTYRESGYFEYNSTENFAHLEDDGNFTVYNQIGTIETGNKSLGHGQFMPYNTLTPGFFSSRYTNTTDETDQILSDNNPRKGEALYAIPFNKANYHFGMEMEAVFTQTENGLDGWGHDIIFEFAGDDDMWFYVDGVLILDLGGIHSAQTGKVNFRTGQISSSRGSSDLRTRFKESYLAQKQGASEQEAETWLNGIFKENTSVFRDFSSHSMKMIYMERGAGASNLHMRFNLAAVKPGTVLLNKTISGTDKTDYDLAEFPYQIYYTSKADGEKTWKLLTEKSGQDGSQSYNVTYRGKSVPVKYAASYTPPGTGSAYEHVFFLKAGQSAEIRLPDDVGQYYITECGLNPGIYDRVTANGQSLTGRENADKSRMDYPVAADTMENRQQVTYDNHVSANAMRTLTIRKKLFAEDGRTVVKDDPTGFSFRLSLAGENDDLTLANMQPYHVKDEAGDYCSWDVEAQSFRTLGKKEWKDLSDEEKTSATFHTSINGSISKIPAGYSIEIRDLIVGSRFKIEERESEIPAGYKLRTEDGYSRIGGSYITDQGDTANSGTIRDNSDPAIEVRNQRGWGISAVKEWSDDSYMESHDPVYFAVYLSGRDGQQRLLEGSVRQLTEDPASLYWYFDQLEEGVSFDDYEIFEVKLENPQTDEQGHVTAYEGIEPIREGGRIHLGGTAKGKDHADEGFSYMVSYQKGQAQGSSETVKNVRKDIISNFREGIRLLKKDAGGRPLAGAVFSLKDSRGNDPGSSQYVSDENGWISLAFLEREETYTLKELRTPKGYQSLLADDKIEIRLDKEGKVYVNGSDQSAKGYTLTQASEGQLAEITVINVPFTLSARKIDGETRLPMKDVHFRLFSQVFDLDGQPVRDYYPMMGYEKLLTDDKGVIPKVNEGLDPGIYYLSELQPPAGYEALSSDLCFSISPTGKIEFENQDLMTWLDKKEENGGIRYTLMVSNIKKRTVRIIKKGMDKGSPLAGAVFSLYEESKVEDDKPREGEKADYSGTTQEDGGLDLGQLPPGTYYLFEDKAPEGYEALDAPIIMTCQLGRFTAFYHGEPLEVDEVHAGLRQITVWNSAGYELPESGGRGSWPYQLSGILALAAALTLLLRNRLSSKS